MPAGVFSRAALALVLVSLPAQFSAGLVELAALRGVHPSSKALYGGETIQCDGGKTHPIGAFNDDFCDCSDGTDEPGTSACPNGRFFCRNRGHMAATIFSSRVNDGICDCCDGSDEYSGAKSCQNTCLQAGSAARAELSARAAAYLEGFLEQEKMKVIATGKRAKWESEKQDLQPQIQAQEAVVADLKAKKEVAEAEQKRIDEEKRKAQEEADAAKAAEGGEAAAGEAADVAEGVAGDAAAPGGGADEVPAEGSAAAAEAKEETAEERGRRIARQWTNDALAAGGEEAPPPPATDPEGAAAGAAEGSAEGSVEDYTQPMEKPADWDDAEDGPWEAPENPNKKTALEKAEAALTAAEEHLTTLRGSVERMDRLLAADGGPGGAFFAIADECFSARVDQYTYEMCVYGSARQDPSSTSLGTWAGFDGPGKSVIKFTGGAHCWNGPQRSLTVTAVCGSRSELAEVSEPSRCEYAAKFFTPAACTAELVAGAQEALRVAEAEAASVHDELR